MSSPLRVFTREAFLEQLAARLGRAPSELDPEAELGELGLSALERWLLEAMLLGAGVQFSEEALAAVRSLEDAYHLFAVQDAEPTQVGPVPAATKRGRAGRAARIRPLRPADLDWALALCTDELAGPSGPLRGAMPGPAEFAEVLWAGVLSQVVIESTDSGRPCGIARCHTAELHYKYCYLDLVLDPWFSGRGWPLEGLLLFVDELFRVWPFRKLHMELPEHSLRPLLGRGAGLLFEEEGRLVGHRYDLGRWWDVVLLTLWRARWEEQRALMLGH